MPCEKIARFVDINACRSIFSDFSTFVLRSPEYYRREYEQGRGDERELRIRCAGGGSAESGHFVLSCWTRLEGDEPNEDEWNIFSDSVLAIISTPYKIESFLENVFEMNDEELQQRFPFRSVEHKAVVYKDEVTEKITPHNIYDITVFTKRKQFMCEKEYRFALSYSIVPHLIDSYIFAKTPDEYTENCFANPNMTIENKGRLQQIIMNAICGYGHFYNKKLHKIIANSDVLY